jgi:hypothetical protein
MLELSALMSNVQMVHKYLGGSVLTGAKIDKIKFSVQLD